MGRLYEQYCETVRFSDAYPEAIEIVKSINPNDLHTMVPSSELALVQARAGSMTFLFEAIQTVQSSLVSPLPTAIANFMGVMDALKALGNLLPGTLKQWDPRLTNKDEHELAMIANAIGQIVKVAETVEKITITTSSGHSI